MRTATVAAVVLVVLSIGTCLLLATLGWFAVGFAVMTDCTNDYSCSPTGCSPCAAAGRWINAGAIAQLALAGTGIAALVRRVRLRQPGALAARGVGILAASLLVLLGTTWHAQESYCQPGTPGYARSYCAVEA